MQKCGDCRVPEGALHHFGCDQERCPVCSGQLISCDCMYGFLGYNCLTLEKEHPDIYNNGVSEAEEEKWLKHITKICRVPWIAYPLICAKCGKLWPDLFMVANEEWKKYVQSDMRKEIICRECYDFIVEVTDRNKK